MKKGTAITIIIIGLVIILGLATALVVVLLQKKSAPVGVEVNVTNTLPINRTVNTAPTPINATNVPAEPTIPSDWLTVTDAQNSLSFSYPPEWGVADVQYMPASSEDLFPFKRTDIAIGDQSFQTMFNYFAVVAKFDDVESAYGPGSGHVGRDVLMDVYNSKSVSDLGKDDFTFPPVNAGLVAYTDPVYVENTAGDWRGFYFYTKHTQGIIPEGAPVFLNEAQLMMTNGDTALRLTIFGNEDLLTEVPASNCNFATFADDLNLTNCTIPQELEQDFGDLDLLAGSITS